ncbi:MAG: hypothetical protein FWF86_04770 [Clostridia bacterium]|nr:hypothetical protein [Clostridia bacterium]
MLLRRLMAALFPVLLCLLCCILFQWLDGLMQAGSFFLFLVKGLLLGCMTGLLLPVAGIAAKNNGLVPWLFIAAGLLALLLLYQYLEIQQAVNWPALKALITISGHAVLAEGTVASFLLLTGIINRRK